MDRRLFGWDFGLASVAVRHLKFNNTRIVTRLRSVARTRWQYSRFIDSAIGGLFFTNGRNISVIHRLIGYSAGSFGTQALVGISALVRVPVTGSLHHYFRFWRVLPIQARPSGRQGNRKGDGGDSRNSVRRSRLVRVVGVEGEAGYRRMITTQSALRGHMLVIRNSGFTTARSIRKGVVGVMFAR